jgi:non-heme chloroperoxidase
VFLDSLELQRKLQQLTPGGGQGQNPALVRDLLQTNLPQLEKDLQEQLKIPSAPPAVPVPVLTGATRAIIDGQQKYTKIPVPILAIFAVPHDLGPLGTTTPEARAAQTALDEALVGAQATAFERGLPSARVVRVPHANHYVFLSNEADVLREMETFLGGLK